MAAVFAVIYSATVVAPLVTPISARFGVTAGEVGLLAAAYSVPGILAALVSGPYADRLGRTRLLVGGALVSGAFTIVGAFAPTFALLIAARAVAGIGAALVMPSMVSTVADLFPYHERGRAIATVFAANTLGSLAGVAVGGIVAEQIGWQYSLALAGTASLTSAAAMFIWRAPQPKPAAGGGAVSAYTTILTDSSAVGMVVSNLLGVVAWTTWTTFIVVFFERTFGLAQGIASTYGLVQGAGMLVGSQLGGRVGERVGPQRLLVLSLCLYGALLPGVASGVLPLPFAAVLNLAAGVAFGMRATSNATVMSEQAVSVRTTLFAVAAATVAAGTAFGGAAGGAIVDRWGFGALGGFCGLSALASAAIILRWVRERGSAVRSGAML